MKISDIKSRKGKEKITVLTCYDYSMAKIIDGLVDILLVGDSLGMVIYGHKNTQKVTMQDMIRHVAAVSSGSSKSMIVADLPYKSYENHDDALKNAKMLIEAGAHAVKPEGNKKEIISYLVENGINVMGHIGLTPQTITDFKVQGKGEAEAEQLINDAKDIEEAGAFALVIESIPLDLGKKITESNGIPTIGIGAGKGCDGQVLVINDMLGMFTDFSPKFVRKYAELSEKIKKAVEDYARDVKSMEFPSEEESFHV